MITEQQFARLPTEIIHGEIRDSKLHLTAFLGRGDYFNKKGICISNDSIPKCAPRWIDTPHVITQYKDHILYVQPKHMVFNSMQELAEFLKPQALPHMTGKYVDQFYTTDKNGIHTLYGTSIQTDPFAVQAWKEGKFPRYVSTSLLAVSRNARNMITDWIPIDNTSVDEDPAYGVELARITGDCECDESNKNACIVQLREKVRSADSLQQIAQSAIDHAHDCREKAFRNIKNVFDANNVHIQFLVQSALMSMNNPSTEGSNADSSKSNPPAGDSGTQTKTSESGTDGSFTEVTKSPTKGELTKSFDFLSKTLGEQKSKEAAEAKAEADKNVSNKTNESGKEGENKEQPKKQPDKLNFTPGKEGEETEETPESIKAERDALRKSVKKLEREKDDNLTELLKFKEKTEAKERVQTVIDTVKTLGKELPEKRQGELIEYYTGKEFAVLPEKKLVEMIRVHLSMQEQIVTEKVKQSSMFGMTSKYVAKGNQNNEESEDSGNEFIDVGKIGGYLS